MKTLFSIILFMLLVSCATSSTRLQDCMDQAKSVAMERNKATVKVKTDERSCSFEFNFGDEEE